MKKTIVSIEVLFKNKKFQKYTKSLPVDHDEINEILSNSKFIFLFVFLISDLTRS